MKFLNSRFLVISILFGMACSAQAQSADPANSTAPAADPSFIDRSINAVENDYQEAEKTVENLYDNGRLSMVLSGYAHHGRGTYTPAKIDELNEKVWGFGVSKELRDEKDNEESISFVVMADSHYSPQITAGYAYQWMKPLGQTWEAGIGYTAGLISRTDIINGIPFPGILPLASIGTRDTKLLVSYIPRLSGTGNGDVLFFALRVALK
jgi:lipid IVA palmitoyltransferase